MGFQINQVTVSGNLTRDAEVRQAPSGTVITSISIAHNERRKNNQTGDWEDRAHFFDVTIFGGQGEWLSKNAGKGDPITVSGQLQWRSWEDQQGNKRSAVEILARDIVLGQRGGGGGQGGGQGGGYQQQAPQQGGYQQAPQQGGWQQPQQGGGYQQAAPQQAPQQGGWQQQGSDIAVDQSDFAPAPQGGLSDPGEDDIPF